MPTRFTIAGYGYTAGYLAARLAERGAVTALARSAGSLRNLPAGVTPRRADLGTAEAAVRETDVIVYLAPPPAAGERDTTLDGFLRCSARPARFVYASTSGVYGDCGGQLVDETRAPAPQTARAIRRHAAEQSLRAWCADAGTELVVLRVAGIYGPGRLPLQRLRRREPVLAEDQAGPGNRIHVVDLAETCARAATAASPPDIVNVCDGNHMSSTGFTKLVAKLTGLPPPPEIALEEARAAFTPARWSFLAESRRLDNTRLRRELGVALRYPDPAGGIRAALG